MTYLGKRGPFEAHFIRLFHSLEKLFFLSGGGKGKNLRRLSLN